MHGYVISTQDVIQKYMMDSTDLCKLLRCFFMYEANSSAISGMGSNNSFSNFMSNGNGESINGMSIF